MATGSRDGVRAAALLAALLLAAPATAADKPREEARHCFGEPTPIEAVSLSSKRRLDAGWRLKTGAFYEVHLRSDGSAPIRLEGREFLCAMLTAEVRVDEAFPELGPAGLPSLDFGRAREVRLGFIPTAPGVYRLTAGRGAITVTVE